MFAMALLVPIPTFETIDQCEQLKSLVFAESGTTSYNRSLRNPQKKLMFRQITSHIYER